MSRTRISAMGAFCAFVGVFVAGQSSDVVQCISDYQWAINTRGQTPCLVAAYLETACSGQAITVPALPNGTHYLPPLATQADPCFCSSVTYSMISACGGCQNRTFTSWTNWTTNCGVVTQITKYPRPIPSNVEVPVWAFLNVSATNDIFSPELARSIAVQSPSTRSDTPVISTTSFPTSSSVSADANASTQSKSKSSHAGAIAGGVVGGIMFLGIVGLGTMWYLLRIRQKRIQRKPSERIPIDAEPTSPPMQEYLSMRDEPISPISPSPFSHNLSDPISPATSAMYTTYGGRSSMDSLHRQHRGYTGVPEI